MNRNQLYIYHGTDAKSMVDHLLKRSGIQSEIKPEYHVGIKPNLVEAKPASSGATTHPELVEAVVEFLQEIGVQKITVMESSWVGDDTEEAFRVCGYEELAHRKKIKLVDLKKDVTIKRKAGKIELEVCRSPMEVDYLVNMPVMKGHCQTGITCALKNMKGCIPDAEKRRYHRIGLHEPIAAVNSIIRPDLILVDALNGDLTYEGGGSPVPMDRILLGKDPVLVDAWAAKTMGWEPGEIKYIMLAESLGIGSSCVERAEMQEFGKANRTIDPATLRGDATDYGDFVDAGNACSACYATLLYALKRLDQEGKLTLLVENLKIGQAYKGLNLSRLGIGDCTSNFDQYVPGCPPEASVILEHLRKQTLDE